MGGLQPGIFGEVAEMKVRNRKCIRRLSNRTFWASRRRNLIAACAIALTTLLFTSLFTIVMSLNASYETYQFRQIGGYAHGTFKDVSLEQLAFKDMTIVNREVNSSVVSVIANTAIRFLFRDAHSDLKLSRRIHL